MVKLEPAFTQLIMLILIHNSIKIRVKTKKY